MTSPPDKSAIDDVLRKIGRNVLHFQRMEAMLKFLISRSSLQGTAGELRSNHEKACEAVSRQTMGNLVNALFDSVYSTQENPAPADAGTEEPWLSFSFNIEADGAFPDERKAALKQVVKERNVLIHQLLAAFDQTSSESCRAISRRLDEQAERLRPEYESLRALVRAVQAGRKEAVDALQAKWASNDTSSRE